MTAQVSWPEGGQVALAAQVARAQQALTDSTCAPLSARHALHAAVQIDRISDPAFAGRATIAEPAVATARDLAAFRAALRRAAPALLPIMALAEGGSGRAHLDVRAVPVAPDDVGNLPVADLMVGLYNGGTVPRLMLVPPDGAPVPLQGLLHAALGWWIAALGAQDSGKT